MDKLNSFMLNLDSHHENFKTESQNIDSLIGSIEFYESFIPDFFSKTGEAKAIKEMYNGIKQTMDLERTVICSDVNAGAHIYREYMEGMISFINDIAQTVITESCDELKTYEEKFEKAKQKDAMFIESLYDGKLTAKTETVLSEAVANVEFLIDFIPELQTMKKQCQSLYESFKDEQNEEKKSLLDGSLNMLFESVDNYCYSTISNIVSVYTDIQNTLNNQNTQQVISQPTSFKLF